MDDLHSSEVKEELPVTKEQHTCGISGLDSFHELGSILDETLQPVSTDTASDLPSNSDNSGAHEGGTLSKCLQKSATFPTAVGAEKTVPAVMQAENNANLHRSLSLPNAPKLISAMKGSREKEGLPVKKLSVSWAPDVYDPPPTSVSHYPKRRTHQKLRNNKKHGKGKQKGKNTRGSGSGSKDKKQCNKINGKSNKCVEAYTNTDRVIPRSDYGRSLELLDFTVEDRDEVSCPESNCGSSYRGNTGNALHFACTEAT